MSDFLFDGPPDSSDRFLLAHGAGAPMDSPFLETIATSLAARGMYVVRFEFSYMQERRRSGKRRPPNRQAELEARFEELLYQLPGGPGAWIVGGKSMGGRIASYIADRCGVRGLVCFGYPFHPPRKPDRLRTAHLADLETPTLILQGERDAFGSREEIAGYSLSPTIQVEFLPDGDHSFTPRKRSGTTLEENLRLAVETLQAWLACRSR